MRLTVIGCAGSYPSAASPASCYLLEHDGARLVLDLGNGSLGALQRHLDPTTADGISAVVLSHCHIDHCADLASLFVARHHYAKEHLPPLPVLGPSDAASRAAAIHGGDSAAVLNSSFAFRTHGSGTVELGPFTIRSTPALHPVESYSVLVSAGGRSIAYSGDTGPNPALNELAEGADVALFEAAFVGTGNPVDLHMTGAQAGSAAHDAGVGRLVLTHLVVHNDDNVVLAEASKQFSGPIELAYAGMAFDV